MYILLFLLALRAGAVWGRFGEYERGWLDGKREGKAFAYRMCGKDHDPMFCNPRTLGIENTSK